MNEIKQINSLIKQGEISQGRIAREVNINRGTLSLVLRGKYKGNSKKYENKLRKWYRDRKERENILETSCYRKIRFALQLCKEDKRFGVIMANAGCGKTYTSRYFAQQENNVFYLEANKTYNNAALLYNIGKKIGTNLTKLRGSANSKLNVIIDKLSLEPMTIIVDQSDELNYSQIDILRTIWDSGFCSVVLLGLPVLEEIMTKGRSRKENYDYIYSRVNMRRLVKRPTLDDIALFRDRYGLDLTRNYCKTLLNMINNRGEFRFLTNIFEGTKSFPDIEDDEDKIKASIKLLIGG